MNTDYSNHYDRNENHGYRTHRSERYRYPERDSSYRFDDYGSSARGGYGNEGHSGTWGNQGNEMGGSRNTGNQDTYSTSRNYGNMGSYGGAQGFGDYRGGRHPQGSDYNFYSGASSGGERSNRGSGPRSHGYESDYDSHGSTFQNDSNSRLYGSDTSRRFQGSDQGRYDFDRGSSNRGSGSFRGSDRDSNRGYSGYGGSEGGYMGSGYNRTTRGDYGTGNYGSMGSYDRGSSSMSYGEPYGAGDYSRRHTGYPNETYARDRENPRIQHRDSDYDYDPNHSFDVQRDPYYVASHNRGRTWDRNRY
ncbi:hypothetical protein [Pontibacter flavimaris]|uniref:Uncharacterized protein n=1 Tax=Pontibacter flavimaris TaxID=1797110 RepID=A0A1Q5P963_9BACT|nr:hypothetical protein [Pontibacter flavimaris]OKL38776.1 hypothetical protein A3841_06490 [Pontibacter flavimaris]